MSKHRSVPHTVNRVLTDVGTRYVVTAKGRQPNLIKRDGKYFLYMAITTALCVTLSSM